MRLRLLAPRYWLTWAGLGLLRLVALLPFPWIVALGGLLGKLLRRLPIGFVRTARRVCLAVVFVFERGDHITGPPPFVVAEGWRLSRPLPLVTPAPPADASPAQTF